VLSRIGEQAGIVITIVGDLGAVRPQQFEGLPLARAFRRLVEEQHALLMIYRAPRGGDGTRLHEIRVDADPWAMRPRFRSSTSRFSRS
jgi:hypothetical protein